MNRDFKGIWIPREIWLHESLSIQAKALWAEIDSLYDEDQGGCYASDDYLMKFLGVKISRLHEVMKELKDVGFLEKVSFDGRNRVIKALKPDSEKGGSQTSGKPEPCSPGNRNIDNTIVPKKKKKKRDASLPSIEFDYESNQFVNIEDSDKSDWLKLYPGVNIDLELGKMRQWLMDPNNPERDGNRTFVTNWLSKAQKEVTKTPRKPASTTQEPTIQPNANGSIIPYNSSIAYSILHRDGVESYVDYLKGVSDQKYYNNFLNNKYEQNYVDYLEEQGNE